MVSKIVDLERERRSGHKWLFGPFQPEASGQHSEVVEIGYVNFQKVEKTDKLHLHETCEEYFVVLEGHMQIHVDDKLVDVSEGQILLVRPRTPHLIREVEPGTRILLVEAPPTPNDKVVLQEE